MKLTRTVVLYGLLPLALIVLAVALGVTASDQARASAHSGVYLTGAQMRQRARVEAWLWCKREELRVNETQLVTCQSWTVIACRHTPGLTWQGFCRVNDVWLYTYDHKTGQRNVHVKCSRRVKVWLSDGGRVLHSQARGYRPDKDCYVLESRG